MQTYLSDGARLEVANEHKRKTAGLQEKLASAANSNFLKYDAVLGSGRQIDHFACPLEEPGT
jgi:hypothetical protein